MKDLVDIFRESHPGNIEREREVEFKRSFKVDEQSQPSSGIYVEKKTKDLTEGELIELNLCRSMKRVA